MLTIKNIKKKYVTGELTQTALDDVSLSFRNSEFVAVLGPSGSGKTTLLNIVGGLDRYDSGDLIINGISTKKYKDRDWDSYRNHTIGFVFQSYNLIPHQSVLANVELALTISGVSRSERKKRAREALEKVGLGDQTHKRPNQLSGGQMQRVAIARALVNDPDILLADEPTGALDSETSVQVMELLNEVAKDRLVIMVTHNPELADKYATRIVKLSDGKITGDSNPFEPGEESTPPVHKNMGHSSMSFLTSLSLSFNNLRTKKGRTILTSFAGSIGIIGIALIQALSSGVNAYITDIQRDTMSSYPITIDAETIDIKSMMSVDDSDKNDKVDHAMDAVYSNPKRMQMLVDMSTTVTENNLTRFKKYLDDKNSEIHKYIGGNGIVYSYATKFGLFSYDDDNVLVNSDGSTLVDDELEKTNIGMMMSYGSTEAFSSAAATNMFGGTQVYSQLIPTSDGTGISSAITDNYDIVYGSMPHSYNEMVLVLDMNNEVPVLPLYKLGILKTKEYRDILKSIDKSVDFKIESKRLDYNDICSRDFYILPACDMFDKNSRGTYDDISKDTLRIENKLKSAIKLRISGIIKPKEGVDTAFIKSNVAYTKELTDYIINYTDNSEIVKAQREDPDVNVITGLPFKSETDDEKAESARQYILSLKTSEKAALFSMVYSNIQKDPSLLQGVSAALAPSRTAQSSDNAKEAASAQTSVPQQTSASAQTSQPGQASQSSQTSQAAVQPGMTSMPQDIRPEEMTEEQMAAIVDKFLLSQESAAAKEMLIGLYDKYISSGSYDDNLKNLGVVSVEAPSSIAIYADSFEDKEKIAECIENYNKTVDEDDRITYTDLVALLMSSVTTIINVISYVLMAFVAVSLIVSSIMIGIITYISVLERTKEIGILRAIGASKKNISRVFNAETFIIGLLSGLLGIAVSLLLLIPINIVIHIISGLDTVNAFLPLPHAIILITLSVVLTLIGGLIPSRKAAKRDPVTALRTE
ncbi:MAG: ABC transporter ATP-binding protein/permease [Clostridia bacterium]|nr:ABC transporter ATP-binding protein/permease [Clostridia bacterium]